MKPVFMKFLALVLAVSALFCSPSLAASAPVTEAAGGIAPRASYYLSSYAASCTSSGSTLSVNFNVTATGRMSYVGALGIYVYESSNGSSFDCIRTFYPSGNSQMLKTNSQFHAASVTYDGTNGYYYYAVVSFYAENANGSDTKSYTTSTIRL